MGFSLQAAQGGPAARSTERVARAAKILNLDPYLERYPRELSGGQRQRVAMGRAIVRDPKVFLFDEPLSNLDAKLRVQMRAEIKALHQRLKTTTVYVTHDQIEAMTMADRIVVMHDGAHRADRHAARALRPAGQPVRRAVHRLAGDERRQGHAAPRQRHARTSRPPAACAGRSAGAGRGRPGGRVRRAARAPGARRQRAIAACRGEIIVVEPTGCGDGARVMQSATRRSILVTHGTAGGQPGRQDRRLRVGSRAMCTCSTRHAAQDSKPERTAFVRTPVTVTHATRLVLPESDHPMSNATTKPNASSAPPNGSAATTATRSSIARG